MRRLTWLPTLALMALVGCAEPAPDDADMTDDAAAEAADESAATGEMAGEMALACAPTAEGEELTGRPSPYDSITVDVGEGMAKICYSRPQLRDRTMIGGEAVPYGELWRFGANEPTIIHLSAAANIAGAEVEPGSYSLYTVPMEGDEWTLIVNRSTSQWGHEGRYSAEVEAQEVGRYPIRAETVEGDPIESFTIRPNPDGSGLVAEWQNSRVFIPIEPAM